MSTALVIGSANADLVYSVHDFPMPGQTITARNYSIFAGGKGANQAVACARAGANVELCASLGDDSFGDFLANSILENGLRMTYSTRVTQPTGSAVIFVNQNGENQIVLNPGANHFLTSESIQRAISEINPEITLLQLEITDDAVSAALSQPERTILNPAPFRDLQFVSLEDLFAITPNETETRELIGIAPIDEESTKAAAKKLLDLGVKNAIITLGSRGCYWTNGTKEGFIKPPKVQPVDTTGAGDVFNGCLAARLIAKDDFPAALRFAVTAASLSTTKPGALNSAPHRTDVLAKLLEE